MDDDDECPPEADNTTDDSRAKAPLGEGRARPGTEESRSPSSEDPTRHTERTPELSSKRPVARVNAAIKATPSARCYGGVRP